MGRSGGGGGGGHGSGGHSSGGFSGGSRSSGSFSNRSGRSGGRSSGFTWTRSSHTSSMSFTHFNGDDWSTDSFGSAPMNRNRKRTFYIGRWPLTWYGPTRLPAIIACIIIMWIMVTVGSFSCSANSSGVVHTAINSTVERSVLAASASKDVGWYTDADGDWVSSPSRIEKGLKYFYQETGIRPYVYILPNGSDASDLTSKAEELYDELFTDEGHFLLVFVDDNDGYYDCGYTGGSATKTIMDSEAIGILSDNLAYWYRCADTDEEVFSKTFSDTADDMMAATPGSTQYKSTHRFVKVAIFVIGCIIVFVVVSQVRGRQREKEEERRRQTEKILNTPLEKFGDNDVEDLADKYEEDSPIKDEG